MFLFFSSIWALSVLIPVLIHSCSNKFQFVYLTITSHLALACWKSRKFLISEGKKKILKNSQLKLTPTQTFWKISESINWCGLCFCDFQFISIWHILRNFQGSAALGNPAVAFLLEERGNFCKFMILYKLHIFCILATFQYFYEKITFDDKVIEI